MSSTLTAAKFALAPPYIGLGLPFWRRSYQHTGIGEPCSCLVAESIDLSRFRLNQNLENVIFPSGMQSLTFGLTSSRIDSTFHSILRWRSSMQISVKIFLFSLALTWLHADLCRDVFIWSWIDVAACRSLSRRIHLVLRLHGALLNFVKILISRTKIGEFWCGDTLRALAARGSRSQFVLRGPHNRSF